MVFGPSGVGLEGTPPARAPQRARALDTPAPGARESSVPAAPPPEVLDALDTAARVLEELASRRIGLRFEYVEGAHEVRIQVVNETDGSVIREIPPGGLAELAAGAAVPGV